ncbi:unnamed protein product [Meloidogyne enterolobii]|uniref:Uncharacterized protein n=1 Tax=Meloidogyne enterolobii TaxID=390850 RepID=A0ACB0Z6F4_MELEN
MYKHLIFLKILFDLKEERGGEGIALYLFLFFFKTFFCSSHFFILFTLISKEGERLENLNRNK